MYVDRPAFTILCVDSDPCGRIANERVASSNLVVRSIAANLHTRRYIDSRIAEVGSPAWQPLEFFVCRLHTGYSLLLHPAEVDLDYFLCRP
jgi:hypothetical protein